MAAVRSAPDTESLTRHDCTITPESETENLHTTKTSNHDEKKVTPLPKLQLGILLCALLAEPLTAHVMLPFIVQLIEETGITHGDVGKVGYYSGMIESMFFLSEACMILQWGRISDRVGRRPVLLTGLTGLVLSMLFFGLAHTFPAIVASRVVAGVLNGNVGVIKSMFGEITDETNMAHAMALTPLAWSLGNTLAPLAGGLLQHPFERIGGVFRTPFWCANPYFLPCVLVAASSLTTLTVAFFYLKETAPCKTSTLILPTPERTPLLPKKKHAPPPSLRALFTPRITTTISAYALFAVVEVAFCVLQPLVYSTPISRGGLGMTPALIGSCGAVYGLATGLASTLFFARLTRRLGIRCVALTGAGACAVCVALFPMMNAAARAEEGMGSMTWALLVLQLALGTTHPMAFSAILIYLRSAAPRFALGATNGLAQTSTSIMRAVGPVTATALFAVSVENNLMGGSLVYVIVVGVCVAAGVAAGRLPREVWERED